MRNLAGLGFGGLVDEPRGCGSDHHLSGFGSGIANSQADERQLRQQLLLVKKHSLLTWKDDDDKMMPRRHRGSSIYWVCFWWVAVCSFFRFKFQL